MTSAAGTARAAEILLRSAANRNCTQAGKLLIDNLDGSGPRDYTLAVLRDAGIKIERSLNAPSQCTADVLIAPDGLPLPNRRARVIVNDEAGATLFTGYLATEPVREYAAGATQGCMYRVKLNAVSDEWLLDELGPATNSGDSISLGQNARDVLEQLVQRVGGNGSGITIADTGAELQALGTLQLAETANWSETAKAAAASSYAAFRTLSKQTLLQQAGTTVHALDARDGSLIIADLQLSQTRELANDVTVSGDEEPTTFVSDVFLGDGTTADFALSEVAYRANQRTLLSDAFSGAAVDAKQWALKDPGGFLSTTSAGLTMSGGNGVDGGTTLTALSAVEMGGSIIAELRGVVLNANSNGMLAGFYEGQAVLATCFAGFRVRQNSGATAIVPVIGGAEAGVAFPMMSAHKYHLRVRLYCAETQRVMQRYSCMVDGAVQTFGRGNAVSAPMRIVFDVMDEGDASNAAATVLYDSAAADGPVAITPATCSFVVVNSTNLFGAIASVAVTRPGSLWVESTLANGTKRTRLVGDRNEGNDCDAIYGSSASGPGKLSFFAGRVPASGERVTVFYRAVSRAVARIADQASIAAEIAAGGVGASRWIGKVLQPPARSSADCESAAQAILAFATSRSAAISGTYECINPAADVWPGDLLNVTSGGVTTSLLVRRVVVTDLLTTPEAKSYKITFANDWATELAGGLGLRLSESIATDAVLPQTAVMTPTYLASPNALQVVSVSGSTIVLDTGVDPPSGGGFEVRRSNARFGVVSDVDLVLRSPVRNFSIPRVAQVEKYYVRMYDASTPVNYSRWSSAVFLDVPVG